MDEADRRRGLTRFGIGIAMSMAFLFFGAIAYRVINRDRFEEPTYGPTAPQHLRVPADAKPVKAPSDKSPSKPTS